MKNCDNDIREFHRARVALTESQRLELRDRRDSNRDRLKRGLARTGAPAPAEFITQGSYAMGTIIQEPNKAYDIDDGVVFAREHLRGPRDGEMTPLEARKMVREAVDDGSFKVHPELKTNCVRVHYSDGSHVDIPVYRRFVDPYGRVRYQLASSDWRESNPRGVNDWFEHCMKLKRHLGLKHTRELIQLLKSICKRRPSYSLPSGFVITVLVVECYTMDEGRLDLGLYEVISAVYMRLSASPLVRHPVVDEWLIDHQSSNKCRDLRELLGTLLEALDALHLRNCTLSKALKAWRKVLRTNFFDGRIAEAEKNEKAASAAMVAAQASRAKPWAPGSPRTSG